MHEDPAVTMVIREHARDEHTSPRLDCPVCRRFPPEIDPVTLAHASAPDTSHDAARANQRFRVNLRYRILMRLAYSGPKIADEVAWNMGLDVRQVQPRMTELRRLGLIRFTDTKRTTDLGRAARACEVTDAGHDELHKLGVAIDKHYGEVDE
jgi:hypothetical protein